MIRATFQALGDQAVLVRFGDAISVQTHQAIRRFCVSLTKKPVPGVTEWVPGYVTVAVYYRPGVTPYRSLVENLTARIGTSAKERLPRMRLIAIPTLYGGEQGPDLEEVAAVHGLRVGEVIALHSGPTYLVHMIGFAPGFPYLGGLPESLALPRLAMPRLTVPAGSVAIGGAQTGIYPLAMPGGWHLIGRTPLCLFDGRRQPPALLRAGDSVRFIPITVPQYQRIARRVAAAGNRP